MSAETATEVWADWCAQGDGFAMCGTRMVEHSRRPDGETRWCFTCRKRRDFERVVMTPDGMSYYGPTVGIHCATCGTNDGDCFPGSFREWED